MVKVTWAAKYIAFVNFNFKNASRVWLKMHLNNDRHNNTLLVLWCLLLHVSRNFSMAYSVLEKRCTN